MMDSNYWPGFQINAASTSSSGLGDRSRLGVPVAVEHSQSITVPHVNVGSGIDANSLEFLLNQQRFAAASGMSLIPFAGAAYATHMFDANSSSSCPNVNSVLTYSNVAGQTVFPGIICDSIVTAALTNATVSAHQYKNSSSAGSVTSSATSGLSFTHHQVPVRQPTQHLLTLSDLIDYGIIPDHNTNDTGAPHPASAHMVDSSRSQIVSVSAHLTNSKNHNHSSMAIGQNSTVYSSEPGQQPYLQIHLPDNRIPVSVSQAAESRHLINSVDSISSLSVPGTTSLVIHNPVVASSSSTVELSAAAPTTKSLAQSGIMWPYVDGTLLVGDGLENLRTISTSGLALSLGSMDTQEPVVYEAVSPANGSTDILPFNFLDSLHYVTTDPSTGLPLGNFLGSTFDASALLAAHQQPSVIDATRTSLDATVSYPHVGADSRAPFGSCVSKVASLQHNSSSAETSIVKTSVSDVEKVQKQKTNLGIVMPMTHSRAVTSVTQCDPMTPVGSKSSATDSHYPISDQLSFDKSLSQVADGNANGAGIVLTNITGNVYVNQYTMVPGATQQLDNALLHADFAIPYRVGNITSFDDTSNETYLAQSAQSSSLAVMVQTDNDEIGHFAVDPLTGIKSPNAQPKQFSQVDADQSCKSFSVSENSLPVSEPVHPNPLLTIKPSNEFESSFLKFICGHKAETLSSVLNSPIRTRPELPKYIPEMRRARPALTAETTNTTDTDNTSSQAAVVEKPVQKDLTSIPHQSQEVCQVSETTGNNLSSDTNQPVHLDTSTEWPAVTKLPAKFSHKWKNRTSLSADITPPITVSSAGPSTSKEDAVDVSKTHVSTAGTSNSKTKNDSNVQWTVSKKVKSSRNTKSGLPVLVLKAIPPANTRSSNNK